MEKKVIVGILLLAFFMLSCFAFVSAESITAVSTTEFSINPVSTELINSSPESSLNLNDAFAIVAAVLLIIAAVLLVKRNRKVRKSKKKKQ